MLSALLILAILSRVDAVNYPPNMCYVALWNNGGNVQQQYPLRKPGYNAVQYYSYNSPNTTSANTPDRLEVSNAVNYFFFEDGTQLSIFFIFDLPNDGTGGSIQADITTEDLMNKGVGITVEDDPGDSYSFNAATGTGLIDTTWQPCCTDGCVLSNLPRPPTEEAGNFNPADYSWCVNLDFKSVTGVDRYLVRSMTNYYEDGGSISLYGANLINTEIAPNLANSLKMCYVQCQCIPDEKLLATSGSFNSHEVVFGPTGGLGLYRAGEYCSWIFNFVNVSGISFFWSEFMMAERNDTVSFYWNTLTAKPTADVVYPRVRDANDWTTNITTSQTPFDNTAPYTFNSLRTPANCSPIAQAYVAFSSAVDSPAHKPGFTLYYIVIPLLESLSKNTISLSGSENITINGYNYINGDAHSLKCAWRWSVILGAQPSLTIVNATYNSDNSVTCETPAYVEGRLPFIYVSVSNDGANYFSNELMLTYGVVPCVCEINYVANFLFSLTDFLLSLVSLCPGVTFARCPGTSATLIGPQCLLVTATETVGATVGLVQAAVLAVVSLLQTLPGIVIGSVTSTVLAGCSAA